MFGAAKETYKAIKKKKYVVVKISKAPWSYKKNKNFREYLYHCILHHPQFVLSPIENYFIYVSVDGNYE